MELIRLPGRRHRLAYIGLAYIGLAEDPISSEDPERDRQLYGEAFDNKHS